MLIGYARASTVDQNLDLQRIALTEAGCEHIYIEQMSGGSGIVLNSWPQSVMRVQAIRWLYGSSIVWRDP